MAIPKRVIDISPHAYHRAVSRFNWDKPTATRHIRESLRGGDWYPDPQTPDEYLVLARPQHAPACIITNIQPQRTIHVTTLYPLKNPTRLHPYKQAGGPYTATDIANHYSIG